MRDLTHAVQAERGVLEGLPHWRLFQSRLLGPLAEKSLSLLFGYNFYVAHMIVAIVVLTLCGAVMFYAGRAIGGRQHGWSALLAFQTLFTLLMVRPWLYIWDYFLVLQTAIFMLLVIRRAPWWSFVLLMSVAVFNHEAALFIGVWMVAQALAEAWAERRAPDWRMLASGVVGTLAGILVIEYLRATLLKREIGWEIFSDVDRGPSGPFHSYFNFQLTTNLEDIYQWLTLISVDVKFLIPLTLLLTLALAATLVQRHGAQAAGLAVYAVAQVAALLLFGTPGETRVLLNLVPFLCLAGMLAVKPNWAPEVSDESAETQKRVNWQSAKKI